MNIKICSRKDVDQLLLNKNFSENTAVISFYSPKDTRAADYSPVDYLGKASRLFYACVPDIDLETLPHFGYTYDRNF